MVSCKCICVYLCQAYMLFTLRKWSKTNVILLHNDDWLFQFQTLSQNLLLPFNPQTFHSTDFDPTCWGCLSTEGNDFFLENIQHHMQWERLGMPYGMFLTGRARAEAKEQEKLQSRGELSTFPNNLEIIRERFQCSFVILKTLNL